jgi:ribose transport system permease protein
MESEVSDVAKEGHSGGAVTSAPVTAPPGAARHRLMALAENWGLVGILVAMGAFFAFGTSSGGVFRSTANVDGILANQAVTGLVAFAMVIPLSAGYFDLSTAANMGLVNVGVVSLISPGAPVVVGIAGGLALGLAVGAINGVLVAVLKLNPFVVTLGTSTLISGLVELYTNSQEIVHGIPQSFGEWGVFNFLGIPRPFWLLIVVAVAVWYLLSHVPYGRRLASIGSNERAARLVGIRVDRAILIAFATSGLVAGVAGVLLTSNTGGADPTAGPGYLFPALAAVFLGATTVRPGRYNIWGTVIGVYVVAVGVSGLSLMGAAAWVNSVFNGAALVIAVALSTLMGRARR